MRNRGVQLGSENISLWWSKSGSEFLRHSWFLSDRKKKNTTTYFIVGIVLVFVFFKNSIHLWSFKSHAKIEITKPKHTVKVFCQICLWNRTHNTHQLPLVKKRGRSWVEGGSEKPFNCFYCSLFSILSRCPEVESSIAINSLRQPFPEYSYLRLKN